MHSFPDSLRSDILSLWRQYPLSLDEFSALYLRFRPETTLTKKQVVAALKTIPEYVIQSQLPSRFSWRGRSEFFTLCELSRGSLLFLDSMVIPKYYPGSPLMVLVAVDCYSKSVFLEPHKKLTALSTARCLERILWRFNNSNAKKVISDSGTEVIALTPSPYLGGEAGEEEC